MSTSHIVTILVCLTGSAALPCAAAAPVSPEAQAQVAFLTAYYKGYIAHLAKGRADYVASTPFYSSAVGDLLKANALACKTLSRGDDMCGYSVDGDAILSTQESSPKLTFQKSQFRAMPSGPDTVDVAFNVWPEMGASYQRLIRYRLVKEAGRWLVDDATPGDRKGFDARYGLRRGTNEENARLAAQARDVNEALIWLAGYAEAGQEDRFARFIAWPLTVCDGKAVCVQLAKGAPLSPLMSELKVRYFGKTRHDGPLSSPPDMKEGSVLDAGPLGFTFSNRMWWLNKVDWSRPGAPVYSALSGAR